MVRMHCADRQGRQDRRLDKRDRQIDRDGVMNQGNAIKTKEREGLQGEERDYYITGKPTP